MGDSGEKTDLEVFGLGKRSNDPFADEPTVDNERDIGFCEAAPGRPLHATLEIFSHSPTKSSGLEGSNSKANSSIPDAGGKLYSLPLWLKLSYLTMPGLGPRAEGAHSGTEAAPWPWIEGGEPMAEDVADAPEAVE
jgi:hypothetical protein